jgi:hypothetical protein
MTLLGVVGFLLLGVVVGAFGTLIGAGGGFLLVPLLAFLDPREPPAFLTGISLAVVFVNALSGSLAYARMRRIDYRAGLVFALAGLPGAVLGVFVTHRLDRRLFDPLLGVAMILAAGFVFLRPGFRLPTPHPDRARTLIEADGTRHVYAPRVGLGALLSLGVGFVSSLLGIGGGIIHVPAMAYLLGFPVHVATATSHFVLAIVVLAAVVVHAATGTLWPSLGRIAPLAVGVVGGAQAGAWLSSRIHGRWILVGLAVALASVGVRLLFTR